jgi:hypothetical protein
MDLQPVAVGLKPTPDLRVLMIRGVVLNENGSAAAVVGSQLMEKVQVGRSIEDQSLRIVEANTPKLDGTQDLDALALAGDRDFRGMADAAPGGVKRRILSETGFVGENQRPVLGAGFFLRRG